MTLDRAPALLLLAAVPALLLLRLRSARPRVAEASSLLVWRRVAPSESAPAARPAPPASAWIEATAVAAAALGAADPSVTVGTAVPPVVVVDASASMAVADAPDGRTRAEAAAAAVAAAGLPPSAVRRAVRPREGALAALDAAGGSPVVLLTDRPPEPPVEGVEVVAWGGPARNAAVVAAHGVPAADGAADVIVGIAVGGVDGPVAVQVSVADVASEVTVAAPGVAHVRRLVPVGPGGVVDVRVAMEGDALAADDALRLRRVGGATVELHAPGGFLASPLGRALVAAGALPRPREPSSPAADDPPRLARTAAAPGAPGETVSLVLAVPAAGGGDDVRGDAVVAADHPFARDVHVDPGVVLGARAAGAIAGAAVLLDARGPLVTAEGAGPDGTVRFAFAPGGAWTARDPSFVVLAANLVDHVAGGPQRFEPMTPPADPDEVDVSGRAAGDAGAALRARTPAEGRRALAAPLLLGAAALLVAAAAARARGR